MGKKKQRFFNATVATAVAASGIIAIAPAEAEASASFKDVKQTDYFYDAVASLAERGIIKGFEDGTFLPNKAVTRGQVAKILAGALGLDTTNVQDPGFKDIPTTHQYYGAIAALANAGIIKGFEDGTFRQGEPVLRNHMAKMIAKGFNLQADGTTPFTDVRADYADYITALYTNGVTTGKTATTFDGASNVTRGQLATFVVRAEQPAQVVAEKEVTFAVSSLIANSVVTADGTYRVAQQLNGLFNQANAAALKNAQVVAVVKGDEIVAVKQVALQATSTKAAPLTFDGGNATIDQLSIQTAFIEVKNITVTGGVLVEDVVIAPVASLAPVAAETDKTAVTFSNVQVAKVEVKRDGVAIFSTTKLNALIVAATVQTLEINASVAELTVVATPKITLAASAKVDKMTIPEGKTIQSIIANYNSVKANIASLVNTKGEAVKVSTGGGGGGSSKATTSEKEPEKEADKEPEKQPEKEADKEPEKQPEKETDKEPEKGKEDFPETGEGPGPEPTNPAPTEPEITEPEPTEPETTDPLQAGEIKAAGTYGSDDSSTPKVVQGNLTIHAADVTLKNVIVTGKLILAAGIGEGDVHLQGVQVAGETVVNGGGKNSVYFTDSVLATVIVNKNNGAVRIVAQGSTKVYEVQLESPTIVLERNLDSGYSGFDDIIVSEALQATNTTSTSDSVQVELQGTFETINSRATNIRIDVSAETDIRTLILNAAARVLGTGVIQTARVNAEGSTISQRPQNVVLDISNGTNSVVIGGQTVEDSYSDENATATLTDIEVSQGIISLQMSNFIAGLTADHFEVEAIVRDSAANRDTVTSDTSTADSGTVTTTDSGTVTTGDTITLDNLYYDAAKQRFTFNPFSPVEYADKVIEIRVTPKHDQLSKETVIREYTVSTGFGGRITDIYGIGIANLTIRFREGVGTTTGDVAGIAVTDDYGYYTINLPAGTYTGEFSSAGYVTTYIVASAESNKFSLDQNETAIRAAASQEVKIMLTWGEHPRDLDSHLQGPESNGNEFHIAYYKQQHTENGVVYADLDWDDTSSYGPETTTIRKLVDGEYRFFVHHFSGSKTLRTSGAQVSVFLGNAIVPTQTFTVPVGEGTEIYWDVFDLVVTENGEKVTVRPVNVLSYSRVDLARQIQQENYYIELMEDATIADRIEAVQQKVNELSLPEGTNPTVSYDEATERYTVTYVSGESTRAVTIEPEFYTLTVAHVIERKFNRTIIIIELDNQLQKLQALLDENELLAGTNATVSYDEETNKYTVSYEKAGVTQVIEVYPHVIIVTLEELIADVFDNTVWFSETVTLQERLEKLQNLLDNAKLPAGTNGVITYDAVTAQFVVTYTKQNEEYTVNVSPNFYIEGVTDRISNAFNYNQFEFAYGTAEQQVMERLQAIVEELVLPEGITELVVFFDEQTGRYTVSFDVRGYAETQVIYPQVYVPTLNSLIANGNYSNVTVTSQATVEQKVAAIQQIVDSFVPKEAAATVNVDEFDNYFVDYTENDEVNHVLIYPNFVLKNSVAATGDTIYIVTSTESIYGNIESIRFIGGTTADTMLIEFNDSSDVEYYYNYNPSGLVMTFDEERAAGFNLATVTRVLVSVRNYYGGTETFEIEIAQ